MDNVRNILKDTLLEADTCSRRECPSNMNCDECIDETLDKYEKQVTEQLKSKIRELEKENEELRFYKKMFADNMDKGVAEWLEREKYVEKDR